MHWIETEVKKKFSAGLTCVYSVVFFLSYSGVGRCQIQNRNSSFDKIEFSQLKEFFGWRVDAGNDPDFTEMSYLWADVAKGLNYDLALKNQHILSFPEVGNNEYMDSGHIMPPAGYGVSAAVIFSSAGQIKAVALLDSYRFEIFVDCQGGGNEYQPIFEEWAAKVTKTSIWLVPNETIPRAKLTVINNEDEGACRPL